MARGKARIPMPSILIKASMGLPRYLAASASIPSGVGDAEGFDRYQSGDRDEPPGLDAGEPTQLCNCKAVITAASRLSSVQKGSLPNFAEASK